jgi:hypothetical protein
MIVGAWPKRPMVEAIVLADGKVVDAGDAATHQTACDPAWNFDPVERGIGVQF